MFSLDQSIAEWRRQMLAAGIKTPVPLEELESHLREDIQRQMQSGSNPQASFEIAVQKIGQVQALKAEFMKASELEENRDRKLRIVCLILSALCYALPLVLNTSHILGQMDFTERRLSVAAFVLTILSLFGGFFICGFLPLIAEKRTRTRVQITSSVPVLIWLCVFAFGILPRLELTVGHLTMVTLWAISPMAVFGGFVLGLDEAARRGTSTVKS